MFRGEYSTGITLFPVLTSLYTSAKVQYGKLPLFKVTQVNYHPEVF